MALALRRFWREVAVTAERGIALDGKPVRTPGRVPLVVPTAALADAVAAEWRDVGDTLDPRAMPFTGLTNAAIDRIAPDPHGFAAGLSRYGESDLLCYRAEGPLELTLREAAAWDPILAWGRARFDVHLEVATGITHRAQPPTTLARLADATAALGPWTLAPLSPIVTLTGSILLGLALVARTIEPEEAWAAAHLDEDWQAEQWGLDPLAVDARAIRRREFDAAIAFLALV